MCAMYLICMACFCVTQTIPQFIVHCLYLWWTTRDCDSEDNDNACTIPTIVVISLCLTTISLFFGILNIITRIAINHISTHESIFEHEIKFNANLIINCQKLKQFHKYSFISIVSCFKSVFESFDKNKEWNGHSDVYYSFEIYFIQYNHHKLNVFLELTVLTMTANFDQIKKSMNNLLNQICTDKENDVCEHFVQSLVHNLKLSKNENDEMIVKYGVPLNLICRQLYSSDNGEWIEMETHAAGSDVGANRLSTASSSFEAQIEGFVE